MRRGVPVQTLFAASSARVCFWARRASDRRGGDEFGYDRKGENL